MSPPREEAGIVGLSDSTVASDAVDMSKAIPYHDLEGRVILITGGASGFGGAIADEVVKHGALTIIGDINVKNGEEKVAALRRSSNNHNHHFIKLDVTDWASQAAFFKRAASLSPHQGIDCVIANAGICDVAENTLFEETPDYDSMDNPPPPRMKTVDVNLTGLMYTTTLALSYLSRNPGSTKSTTAPSAGPRDRNLVLISSIAGLAAVPKLPLYGASKHGVVGLFRSMRLTTPIVTGVRVNMINPYFVETGIITTPAAFALAGGALAKIEDVVQAATRLIADKSIIGRGLLVGTRGTPEQVDAAGLKMANGLSEQGIWDVYGHDFEQSDLFVRRVVGVTNIAAAARGWAGMLADVARVLFSPLRKLVGT